MNAPNLTRSVIWGFVYSFEVMTQFMGRLARVPGQSGTCSFITFPDALSMFSRGTSDSQEIARALHSQAALDHIAFNTLHLDANVDSDQPLVSVPTLKDLRIAVAGTKTFVLIGPNSLPQSITHCLNSVPCTHQHTHTHTLFNAHASALTRKNGIDHLIKDQLTCCIHRCQELVRTGSGCIHCGTKSSHATNSCPKLYGRCFQCGRHGHSRSKCPEKPEDFQVPEHFCCRCESCAKVVVVATTS